MFVVTLSNPVAINFSAQGSLRIAIYTRAGVRPMVMLVKLSRICKSLKLRCYVFLHGTIPPPLSLSRACRDISHATRNEWARVKLKDTPPPNTHPCSPLSPPTHLSSSPLPQAGCVGRSRRVLIYVREACLYGSRN